MGRWHEKLSHLFPDFTHGDWVLVDKGDGQELEEWNRSEPRPTPVEINAVTDAQADAAINSARRKSDLEDVDIFKAMIHGIAKNMPGVSAAKLRADILVEYDTIRG